MASLRNMTQSQEKSGDVAPPQVVEALTFDHIDPVAEKKLVRKLDRYIIPFVLITYLLGFLDRVNIGNAKLFGMEEDLGLVGNQYQVAVSLLFVLYILLEVPGNLMLRKVRAGRFLAFIMTSWGIIATLTGLCKNFAGLVVCRLLLGAVEGPLFPAMALYLTFFYTKQEIALRIGYFFVSAAISGAFGGLLGYAIGFMDNVAGQRAWRWIMIIEGLPSVVMGVCLFFALADDAQTAYYLTSSEKEMMKMRKAKENLLCTSADMFLWKDVIKGLTDWKIYVMCAAQFGADVMLYGFSTFLPTIIKGIGSWNNYQVQLLTIPCYATGAIAYLIVARISDAQQKRGIYVIGSGIVAIIGYAILAADVSSGAHYAGCFFVAMGLYILVGLPVAWISSNQPRYGKRATAIGMQLAIGNSAGIMASFLYPTAEAPRYFRGQIVTVAMVTWAVVVHTCMLCYFHWRNRQRMAGKEDGKIARLTEQEVNELGDESPRFLFTI